MLIPFLIPFIIALFFAINMGGSGTAPAFSAAYGANSINKSIIPGLFGIMVLIGSLIGGEQTAKTIGKGLLNPKFMSFQIVSIIFLCVAISLLIANLLGIPQSTSQSTVLAVSAPALYYNCLDTNKLFAEIIPTWFIMPIVGFILSLLCGHFIYKKLRKKGWTITKKVNESKWLRNSLLLISCYVAFSIGTNNVANAAGPLAQMALNELGVNSSNYTHVLILTTLIIAPGFGIGSSLFGNKILEKTGKQIVLFGRIEAIIINFISASLLLSASLIKGIPTSLVQLNLGAILGIGVAKLGFKNIFTNKEIKKFFTMWIIAPIFAFILSFLFTMIYDTYF